MWPIGLWEAVTNFENLKSKIIDCLFIEPVPKEIENAKDFPELLEAVTTLNNSYTAIVVERNGDFYYKDASEYTPLERSVVFGEFDVPEPPNITICKICDVSTEGFVQNVFTYNPHDAFFFDYYGEIYCSAIGDY